MDQIGSYLRSILCCTTKRLNDSVLPPSPYFLCDILIVNSLQFFVVDLSFWCEQTSEAIWRLGKNRFIGWSPRNKLAKRPFAG